MIISLEQLLAIACATLAIAFGIAALLIPPKTIRLPARGEFRHTADAFVRTLSEQPTKPGTPGFYGRLQRALRQADVQFVLPYEFVLIQIATGVGMGLAVLTTTGATLVAVFVGVIGYSLPGAWLGWRRGRRIKQFEEQMYSVLLSMAAQLEAGEGLPSVIRSVADADPPLGPIFARMTTQMANNVSFRDSLEDAQQRVSMDIFDLFALTTQLSYERGGAVAATLRELAKSINRRIQMRADIETKFAQPKLSYMIVVGMGPMVLAFWVIQRPELVRDLIISPFGQIGFVIMMGFALLGYHIMNRLATLEAAL